MNVFCLLACLPSSSLLKHKHLTACSLLISEQGSRLKGLLKEREEMAFFWAVLLPLFLILLLKKLDSRSRRRRLREERAEVAWLQRVPPRLRAAISDAEQQQQNKDEGLLLWLQQIKDVACGAEDLIDELEYEELRSKVGDDGGRLRGSSLFGRSLLPPPDKAMVHKINDIRRGLEDIAKERNIIGLGLREDGGLADHKDTQRRMRQTGSLVKDGQVLGREKEKEEIIQFLLASDDEASPTTIAITGMGGLGKTTLAQLVYNDRRVEEHFNVKTWVCVTDDHDVVKLTREILGSIGYDMQLLWGLENLDVYQRKLEEKLKGQRFLLVIDNLWDRDHEKWQNLLVPLIYGEKGSKVIVTTRDTKVARNFQPRKMVELEGLQFHDCWMLFRKHAFINRNSGEHPRLEAIGKQIVEKFKGVPLAAVTMGGLLHSELEESEWKRILESQVWEEHGGDGILSILKLSYDRLPPQLKQCFAYCSLFPKNYKLDKLELVQEWMAEGFVQAVGRRTMEDVGTEYFNDLLCRSFFQFANGRFAIHDLIHDLARLISHCDHSTIGIDGSQEVVLKDVHMHRLRHLSLLVRSRHPDQSSLEALCRYRSLRTLVFYFPRNIKFQIPHDIFLSLNTLRVLDLSCGGIEILPDSIGTLIHLRYLDLRRNDFKRLPESLCHLYLLQTLKLKGCNYIEELPRGISKLINLRHLEAEPRLLSDVVEFGKLTGLQELELFPISEGDGLRIEDLKDMNELRGALCICNLGRVRSKEEAERAMLSSKRHLLKLEMRWDEVVGRGDSKHEEEVLEALVPPPDLRNLTLECYNGIRCPSWMEQQSMAKLETLRLSKCRALYSLPALWRLSFLRTVEFVGCPQLRDLPSLPTTLRELTVENVGIEELPEFYQHSEPGNCNSISPSLSILEIKNCPALKSLQRGLLRHHLRNLTVLCIQSCEQLVEWPEGDGFRATLLTLQTELSLNDCPKLMAFPPGSTFSASLERFEVIDCPGVLNGPLFAQLQGLSSETIVHLSSEEALRRRRQMRAVRWLVVEEGLKGVAKIFE